MGSAVTTPGGSHLATVSRYLTYLDKRSDNETPHVSSTSTSTFIKLIKSFQISHQLSKHNSLKKIF